MQGNVDKLNQFNRSAAEDQTDPPVAGGFSDDFTVICAWCGLCSHVGRGPVSHNICAICRVEFFPDIPVEGDHETQ